METQITNIIVEGDRLKVFLTIDGSEEVGTFMPESTVKDIQGWVEERITFKKNLQTRREELKSKLMNKVWQS